MGDAADLYDDLVYAEDLYPKASDYFDKGTEWLIEHTKNSRKPIIMSIRKQWSENKTISHKQQWVLAYWVMQQDEKYS